MAVGTCSRLAERISSPNPSSSRVITFRVPSAWFFEGFDSPYRVDPTEPARLLELGPYAAQRSRGEDP